MKFSMTKWQKKKKLPFNTGDCLIEVTTLAGLTACIVKCPWSSQEQNIQLQIHITLD
jgi:hypothetical protein